VLTTDRIFTTTIKQELQTKMNRGADFIRNSREGERAHLGREVKI